MRVKLVFPDRVIEVHTQFQSVIEDILDFWAAYDDVVTTMRSIPMY